MILPACRQAGWANVPAECVTRIKIVKFLFLIVWMMAGGLPYTPFSRSVQTAWRCFVQKARYWTFRVKGPVKRDQVRVMELNVNKPLMTCRKELSWRQNCRYFSRGQEDCNGQAGYWLQVFRHLGGKNITQAFIRNVRGFLINVQNAATRSPANGGAATAIRKAKVISKKCHMANNIINWSVSGNLQDKVQNKILRRQTTTGQNNIADSFTNR